MGLQWKVTPDVERYAEALDYFGARTVISAVDARKLDDDAKQQAFWVGGGLHLTQVQRVFDELSAAIARGDSFDDFKKSIRETLRDPRHVETVFRNATQRAYNAGRYAQMKEPNTARFRPVWLFDAVMDPRVTAVCEACNGTMLPHTDPWWDSRIPPLHHRCRSSIRNLRQSEADKRKAKPLESDDKTTPSKGWGLPPGAAQQWKPDPAKHDPALLAAFNAKAEEGTKKRKPGTPKAKKPAIDLATWVPYYEPKYGPDAAKSVGRGRAALELGLDLPVSRVRELLYGIEASGVYIVRIDGALKDLDGARTLRDQAGEIDPMRRLAAAFAGHLETLKKRKTPLEHTFVDGRAMRDIDTDRRTLDFIGALVSRRAKVPDKSWKFYRIDNVLPGGSWCAASSKTMLVTGREGALAHEYAHAIEALNPELEERAIAFLKARRKGFKLEVYGANGLCWKDHFSNAYVGKRYTVDPTKQDSDEEPDAELRATEVMSMGTEILFAGFTHWGTLQQSWLDDPDHLLFVLGQLGGL